MYLHKLPYKILTLTLNKASITYQELVSYYVFFIGSNELWGSKMWLTCRYWYV